MADPLTDVARPRVLDPNHAQLARELAQDLFPADEILARYGFLGSTDPAWEELQRSHDFISLINQAIKEWNTADSTPKRIRYKALASMELMLVELHVIGMSNASVERKLEAMKLMKSIAGFDSNGSGIGLSGDGAGGGGVQININIGGKRVSATLGTPPVIDGTAVPIAIGASQAMGESSDDDSIILGAIK